MSRKDDGKTSRELVEETLELVRENNRMLRAMRRDAFWGMIFKLLFWALIIGLPVWLYFTYLAPILEQMLGVYTSLQEGVQGLEEAQNQLDSIPEFPSVDGLFDFFGGNQ